MQTSKTSLRLLVLAAIGGLAGCSAFNPTGGSSDFSCPGMPQGIVCKSTMAVYESTHEASPQSEHDIPVTFNPDGSVTNRQSSDAYQSVARYAPQTIPVPDALSPSVAAPVADSSSRPRGARDPETFLRDMERASDTARDRVARSGAQTYLPIRTPATVMRIWIAPWIDKNDDLHVPSYLYTEVEARKWTIGSLPNLGASVVVPHKDTTVTAGQVGAQGQGPVIPRQGSVGRGDGAGAASSGGDRSASAAANNPTTAAGNVASQFDSLNFNPAVNLNDRAGSATSAPMFAQ